ncbi:hypothetical protein C8R45DRAFT_1103411 [Mycena sanguinolenta]|nr:hypothetical protein C8R45DRAFT_1103411 [Mycena sanguinolenta]
MKQNILRKRQRLERKIVPLLTLFSLPPPSFLVPRFNSSCAGETNSGNHGHTICGDWDRLYNEHSGESLLSLGWGMVCRIWLFRQGFPSYQLRFAWPDVVHVASQIDVSLTRLDPSSRGVSPLKQLAPTDNSSIGTSRIQDYVLRSPSVTSLSAAALHLDRDARPTQCAGAFWVRIKARTLPWRGYRSHSFCAPCPRRFDLDSLGLGINVRRPEITRLFVGGSRADDVQPSLFAFHRWHPWHRRHHVSVIDAPLLVAPTRLPHRHPHFWCRPPKLFSISLRLPSTSTSLRDLPIHYPRIDIPFLLRILPAAFSPPVPSFPSVSNPTSTPLASVNYFFEHSPLSGRRLISFNTWSLPLCGAFCAVFCDALFL